MNRIIVLLSLFILVSCEKTSQVNYNSSEETTPSLTASYIEGQWKMKSTEEVEVGITIIEEGEITFLSSGDFSANTGARCHSQEAGSDIFSFSGIDIGTWRVEGGKLILNYTTIGIDEFSSKVPMVTRKLLEDEAKDHIGKDEIYRVMSLSNDSMELIEEEEDSPYLYTRIKEG